MNAILCRTLRAMSACLLLAAGACGRDDVAGPVDASSASANDAGHGALDQRLIALLARQGYTGRVGTTLTSRLGRPLDPARVEIGRMLWFDPVTGLNNDNSCGGCHSPANGFGDTQSIAIGIDNNGIVGPSRTGPRNQRRTPMAANTAFYPTLMWNSRFASLSGDPFDNSQGFLFPPPEGLTLSHLDQLLQAQAFIPPTERNEAAGFTVPGTSSNLRDSVLARLNAIPAYRRLFGRAFPEVREGAPINFDQFGQAIAEFEFTLVFANAPIDRFARGERTALTEDQKAGGVLFFGRAGCVKCHATAGQSNEMFSDFRQHVAGIPQISPRVTNSFFDGPGANEDFGLEQVSGNPADRYMFRSSPLRNVALQPAFMHNGAFTRLDDAVRHHLDALRRSSSYSPERLAPDLRGPLGPAEPVLQRLDALLRRPVVLSDREFAQLIDFLRQGLLDPAAAPERLRHLVPAELPSGRTPMRFEFPAADPGR